MLTQPILQENKTDVFILITGTDRSGQILNVDLDQTFQNEVSDQDLNSLLLIQQFLGTPRSGKERLFKF